jgi:hypothetical protein
VNEAAPWPICYVAIPAWASRLGERLSQRRDLGLALESGENLECDFAAISQYKKPYIKNDKQLAELGTAKLIDVES